jgi:pimeloyl-ACP methyl ester carboxylesterase
MSSPLHAVTAGRGPRVVLVHGSAADHTTWTIQLANAQLRESLELVAIDRRADATTVEEHAADLADFVEAGPQPVTLVGSSFGAVCCLELARRRPELVRGAILCEPPLPPNDDGPLGSVDFVAQLDARAAVEGPEAAAEQFLRTVLGDAAYERMPRMYQNRSKAMWTSIRSDCLALNAYKVRYPSLRDVNVPFLLLGGDRSAPYFRPTLEALGAHLPHARLETLTGAGHMMHADAHRSFAEKLLAFAGANRPSA